MQRIARGRPQDPRRRSVSVDCRPALRYHLAMRWLNVGGIAPGNGIAGLEGANDRQGTTILGPRFRAD